MHWQKLIRDFSGLANAVVDVTSLNKVADFLGHHKKTVRDWVRGAAPSDANDVAGLLIMALKNGVDVTRFQTFEPIYDFSPLLSYEEKAQAGPPDLDWLVGAQSPPVVKTSFCGIEFDGPVGIASSPLLSDERWANLILGLSYGGPSTFKTRRTGPKTSWEPPQIAFVLESPDLRNYDPDSPPQVLVSLKRSEVPDPIPSMVNSIGVPSERTAAVWQELYDRITKHPKGRFVGLSIMADGDTHTDFIEDVKTGVAMAAELRPPFVEDNPSCPNLEKDGDVWKDPALLKKICTEAIAVLRPKGIPFVLKLPYLRDAQLRVVVKTIGGLVDGISFHNTLRIRPVAKDHRDDRLYNPFPRREFGGLSGPCTFQIGLRALNQLVEIKEEFKYDFDIAAIGGISTEAEAVECLNAGANVVQVCSAAMFDPLLAWKIRFHMKPSDFDMSSKEAAELLWYRNPSERESLRNAYEAVSQIQRRSPHRAVSWERFASIWNEWIQQQPASAVGRAHRLPAPKSMAQWTKEFLR